MDDLTPHEDTVTVFSTGFTLDVDSKIAWINIQWTRSCYKV